MGMSQNRSIDRHILLNVDEQIKSNRERVLHKSVQFPFYNAPVYRSWYWLILIKCKPAVFTMLSYRIAYNDGQNLDHMRPRQFYCRTKSECWTVSNMHECQIIRTGPGDNEYQDKMCESMLDRWGRIVLTKTSHGQEKRCWERRGLQRSCQGGGCLELLLVLEHLGALERPCRQRPSRWPLSLPSRAEQPTCEPDPPPSGQPPPSPPWTWKPPVSQPASPLPVFHSGLLDLDGAPHSHCCVISCLLQSWQLWRGCPETNFR